MKILQLCKKFPYPLKDGESIAVTYLTKAMVSHGCDVTLLSMNTVKHEVDLDKLPKSYDHYSSIHCVHIDNRVKPINAFVNLFSSKSYHIQRFVNEKFRTKLTDLLRSRQYDVIQLETLYLVPYIQTIREHSAAMIVLRSHNVEFEIWERITSNTKWGIKKWYLNHLTQKLKKFELNTLNDIDFLIAISNRDLNQFRKMGLKKEGMSIPIGLEIDKYIPKPVEEDNSKSVSFIGSLDWMPNLEGVRWFLKNVWPKFYERNPDYTFHIAGRNAPKELMEESGNGVVVHGEVDSAIDFINSYPLMVVPLFSGSGTRVKILEGMALKKGIVTTTVGVEGIEVGSGKQLWIADSALDFIDAMEAAFRSIDHLEQIGCNARDFIDLNYNHKSVASKLVEKYKDLV